jgi:U3 small nucleolar RNA-associated protein 20
MMDILSFDHDSIQVLCRFLLDLLLHYSTEESQVEDPFCRFAVGLGLRTYVRLAKRTGGIDSTLWTRLHNAGPDFTRLVPFLEGLLEYGEACSLEGPMPTASDRLVLSLIENLSSPSHQIRLVSLQFLSLVPLGSDRQHHDAIATAIEIESSSLNLQTARVISMNIRRLVSFYIEEASHGCFGRLIPTYCLGLLSFKSAQVSQDACEAIKTICESKTGEQVVADIILPWLKQCSPHKTGHASTKTMPNTQATSDFRCTNVQMLQGLVKISFDDVQHAAVREVAASETELALCEREPTAARTQSLRVLNNVPQVAERRSRQIVPIFLSWASQDDENVGGLETSTKSSVTVTTDELTDQWSVEDRKAMLGVFGKFQNPRVLYKSNEVYDSLLDFLSNGDNDIQKAALTALCTWKKASVMPYEANLANLLDESRFSDELSIFMQVGTEDHVLASHREDLVPLVLRILYGKVVSQRGSHDQDAKRKKVVRSFDRLDDDDLAAFIRIAFGSLNDLHLFVDGKVVEQCLAYEFVSLGKQLGLLKMVETMLETLGSRLLAFADQFMNAVLYCLIRSSRALANKSVETSKSVMALRNARQVGIQCLNLLFVNLRGFDFRGHIPLIFAEIINPRVEKFAGETSQSISGLLRLFGTWASVPRTSLYLSEFNKTLIREVANCLNTNNAKPEVQLFVLDEILQKLITFADEAETGSSNDSIQGEVRSKVVLPNVHHVLSVLGRLIRSNPSRRLMDSAVHVLSDISPFATSSDEIESLISTILFVIRQPSERVSPKSKGGLMKTLANLLPHISGHGDTLLLEVYHVISSSFNFFRDRSNRETLSTVLMILASKKEELSEVAGLCADLNAFSNQQLDELDFERRLEAFTKLNETAWKTFSATQWRPLLFNLLYDVRNEEEMAIRSSASFGLRKFIERALLDTESQDTGFQALVDQDLLPALRNGMKHKAELVRMEFVSVLGFFVKCFPASSAVGDLHPLLVDNDEEASFFNNILHIQQHRRTRALRRLANEIRNGRIKSKNISNIFLPLIEHFVFDTIEADDAHNLTSEAISTIGVLGEWLEWTQFRATFRRYRGFMETRSSLEKINIKLLGHFADALCRASSQAQARASHVEGSMEYDDDTPSIISTLSLTLPPQDTLISELATNHIPFLTGFIHNKDESEISLRIPITVTTVKLLKLLPQDQINEFLPPVLLDASSILRSKSQESRDIARKTLADIMMLLGPSYFGFVLKELRSALPRGAQLHILSFTMHSLLVITADAFQTGDLDYCLSGIVSVVMEDVFGLIGQEKDAEDYNSKMKEVKSNKSYDSMELLAKHTAMKNLHQLILPLQTLLKDKLNSRVLKKADELLRRIGVGILRNQSAESRDLLTFCYELVRESYGPSTTNPIQFANTKATKDRFLVQAGPANKSSYRGSTTSYSFKLKKFALDVLRSVLQKHNSLLTAENISGFLPMIGDTLLQPQEEVKISSLRLISTVVRVPLVAIDRSAPTYIAEAMKMVKNSPDTSHEAAQAALKAMTAILRERKTVDIRDADLSYILQRLQTDLEEPDRQGISFNFVKAVMSRKIVVAEVYDLMDTIATMMVTNHNRGARDMARGVYHQFLMHYPQGKTRWSKQLGFLVKNMSYEHQDGRKSVLEAIHLLLSKVGENMMQEIVGAVFVPVLMVVANDDSAECREMGAALLREIFQRSDEEQVRSFASVLRNWLGQSENPSLTVLALQAYRIFFDASVASAVDEVQFVQDRLYSVLKSEIRKPSGAHWESIYFALQLFARVSTLFPVSALSASSGPIWSTVQSCLTYPHAWVKGSAAKLMGVYLADLAKGNADSGYKSLPLVGSANLPFEAGSMIEVARASLKVMQTLHVSEELATQSVRNLLFLGRCFAANGLKMQAGHSNETTEDASDAEDGDPDSSADAELQSRSQRTVLQYIFERLSAIIRKEPVTTQAPSLIPKTAAMQLLASMCSHLDETALQPSLPTIFLPLQILTDPSIPAPRSIDEEFQNAQKALVTSSQEILDLLQKKLGTTEYVSQISKVKEGIKQRRENRKIKRRIEVVADPEKAGRDKKKKNERKKERRKEIGADERSKRRGW